MARNNFSFKKRQKELKRKKKQEEKRNRKLAKKSGIIEEFPVEANEEGSILQTPDGDALKESEAAAPALSSATIDSRSDLG